jgi:cyclopropane-fatty-acyl-phospholipid synthase
MFPLSNMLKSFVRIGALKVIDAQGKAHMFAGQPGPSVTMRLNDASLYYKLFFNPELNAGEAYMDGRLSFEDGDLRDFLTLYSTNTGALDSYPLQHVLRKFSKAFRRLQQNNAKGKAQQNVAHHYDLGNEFYKLFLDEDMQYSCGYFETEDDSLEDAQRNKLRLVASKLSLQPGLKILDIGSGWGGLALYLASVEDVEILGVTLSSEQCELANERARAAGVADRVRFELRDYRDLDETFDRIVSVGMFEHVGVHRYDEFFGKINTLLHENGVALLHSIGHMSPPSFASPWLRKYIFPGGYSPALSEVFEAVEPNRLWVTDVEILRIHYADTLREWHKRFQANRDKVEDMYDAKFCRMWEFYLISAEMMFRTGAQMVFHMQLAHKRDAVPIKRDYMAERRQQFRAWEMEQDGKVKGIAASGD